MMTIKEQVIQVLMNYFTGRGSTEALPLEEHCANMATDLETAGLLKTG